MFDLYFILFFNIFNLLNTFSKIYNIYLFFHARFIQHWKWCDSMWFWIYLYKMYLKQRPKSVYFLHFGHEGDFEFVCVFLFLYCVCVFVFVCIFSPHPGVLCVNKRVRFPRGKPKHTYITRCFRSSPESEFTVALLAHSHHLLSPVPSVFRTCNTSRPVTHIYNQKTNL